MTSFSFFADFCYKNNKHKGIVQPIVYRASDEIDEIISFSSEINHTISGLNF